MGITMKEMKEWLKTSATEIRIRKTMHKQYQREGYENYEYYYEFDGCSGSERSWRINTKKDAKKYFDNFDALWKLRREYRHRHIAYSELKGKTRDQIEASYPYEGQSKWERPDEERIREIKFSMEPIVRRSLLHRLGASSQMV